MAVPFGKLGGGGGGFMGKLFSRAMDTGDPIATSLNKVFPIKKFMFKARAPKGYKGPTYYQ
jgi:hypothetical protein